MSFDVFENIFTASDPAGGRAIKVSALAGIDNAESYYTQNDPAGGRAIKVKIIAGGASTGTLQVEGGVALDGTTRNITDSSSPTAVASPLFLSTESVTIRPNPLSLPTPPSDLVLLTLDSSALSTVNSTIRVNARTGRTAFIRFSHGTGSGFTNIGDFRADSTNGLAFNASGSFPITFYVNETVRKSMRIQSAGNVTIGYGLNVTSGDIDVSNTTVFSVSSSGNITGTGNLTISGAGASSAPATSLTGAWFTGGSSTTTKPQVLIEPTGATSTNWDTNGTGLGINAVSGFAGNLMDLQLNGTSRFRVANSGTTTIGIASTGTSILSGLSVQASTAATSVATTQYSPFLSLVGNAWNSTSTTSVNVGFRMYALPVGGGTPAGSMILESSNDGFSVSNQQLSISTGGVFTFRQFVALGFASSGIMNIMNQNQINITRVNFGPNNASTTPALAVVTTSATGDTLSAVDSRTTGAQAVFLRGRLSTSTAAVLASGLTPTHTIVIHDSGGVAYRVPCLV